ncbi:MAG: hypothetical protein ACI4II_09655 [Acutalibacteraceae bacterium]
MKRILLENAYEAWISAVGYCKDILNGKGTLQYQKSFVSSLHNAIELFLKQIMLDVGNHNVAKIYEIKDTNDAQLALDYMKAENLNVFFDNLSVEKLQRFRTIEFSKLIDQHKKILNKSLSQTDTLRDELVILQNLRNNETHFLIRQNSFLSETDFCSLHNLMVKFYKILEDYDLLSFWGEPIGREVKIKFDRNTLQTFSYSDAVRNSPLVKELVKILNDWEDVDPDLSSYSIARKIVILNPEYEPQFNDVWTMVEMMQSIGMIKIDKVEISEEEHDSAEYYPQVHYFMTIE